jgi:dTDP-4-amino-4,6-dideoxygalactose transaminase
MTNPRPPRDTNHPDAALLARSQRALAWWAEQTPATPTSSITGGGAIAAVEDAVSQLTMNKFALALPNATYGLRIALLAVGVRPGDDVLVSALDWPAGRAAARRLGARPIPVDIDPRTLTTDPAKIAAVRTRGTTALLVTHLHGVCADVPALRTALDDQLPVIEDAAQAFTATLDGRPAGSLADIAVFSFGPNKAIDAGELAVLTTRDEKLLRAAIRASQHPVRQLLTGSSPPDEDNLSGRPAPLSALLAAYELHHWPQRAQQLQQADHQLHKLLDDNPTTELTRLTETPRRTGQPGTTAVLLPRPATGRLSLPHRLRSGHTITVSTSGATTCGGLHNETQRHAQALTNRIRLLILSQHAE